MFVNMYITLNYGNFNLHMQSVFPLREKCWHSTK